MPIDETKKLKLDVRDEVRIKSETYHRLVQPRLNNLKEKMIKMSDKEFQDLVANPGVYLEETGLELTEEDQKAFAKVLTDFRDNINEIMNGYKPQAQENAVC
jgi:hypothetical protein